MTQENCSPFLLSYGSPDGSITYLYLILHAYPIGLWLGFVLRQHARPPILFKCNAFKSVLLFVVLHIVTPQNNSHVMLKSPDIFLASYSHLSSHLSGLN